jgi:hypothetical protein
MSGTPVPLPSGHRLQGQRWDWSLLVTRMRRNWKDAPRKGSARAFLNFCMPLVVSMDGRGEGCAPERKARDVIFGCLLIGTVSGYALAALALWLGAPLWIAALLLLALPSLTVLVLLGLRHYGAGSNAADLKPPPARGPSPLGR